MKIFHFRVIYVILGVFIPFFIQFNGMLFGDELKKNKNSDASSVSSTVGFTEIEAGWNGYAGFGPRFDLKLSDYFSINAGLGLGAWSYRISTGLRLFRTYPYGPALGLGMAYNRGKGKILQNRGTVDPNGNIQEEEIVREYKQITTINTSFLYSWKFGKDKFYIEIGYAYPLQDEYYVYYIDSGNRIRHRDDKWTEPGGVIISLGYGFRI